MHAVAGRRVGSSEASIGVAVYPLEDTRELIRHWGELSDDLRSGVSELFGFEFGVARDSLPEPPVREAGAQARLKVYAEPKDFGPGSNQKTIIRYALDRGFRQLVIVSQRALTEQLLTRAIEAARQGSDVLLVKTEPLSSGQRAAAFAVNRILGLSLKSSCHGLRMFSREVMRTVPFDSNSDSARFDLELLIQCRAMNVPMTEIEADPGLAAAPVQTPDLLAGVWSALKYRIHQLHLWRYSNYIVLPDTPYTYKSSPRSSHVMITNLVDPETNVLDVGCSQGMLAGPLKEKDVSVTGIDIISEDLISDNVERYHRCDIDKLGELHLERNYDYVILADVLEHLKAPLDVLAQAKRHLRPHGKLIASTPNIAIWFYRLSLLIGRFEYGPKGILDATHVHLYTLSSFRRLIQQAGFQVTRSSFTGLPFEVVFESTGRSRLIRFLSWSYYRLVKLWPAMFAYQSIIEAEITSLDQQSGEGLIHGE